MAAWRVGRPFARAASPGGGGAGAERARRGQAVVRRPRGRPVVCGGECAASGGENTDCGGFVLDAVVTFLNVFVWLKELFIGEY